MTNKQRDVLLWDQEKITIMKTSVYCRKRICCWWSWVWTRMGSPRIFKIGFHLHKLHSLSIICDVKLEGALYSVFYAEASKRLWTSLNEQGMCQNLSLIIASMGLPLAASHMHQLSFRLYMISSIGTIQSNTKTPAILATCKTNKKTVKSILPSARALHKSSRMPTTLAHMVTRCRQRQSSCGWSKAYDAFLYGVLFADCQKWW